MEFEATRTYKVKLDDDDMAKLKAKVLADGGEEFEHLTSLVYACTVQVDGGDMQGILYLIGNAAEPDREMEWLDYEPEGHVGKAYATVRFEAEDTDWNYEGA